jgi:hypothetical protein
MGQPAFCIIGDDVSYPTVARKYARHERLGFPSIAEALKDRGSPDPEDDERYSFPDDSVLLMIGQTQELVDACKAAVDSGIGWIQTSSQSSLALRYARIEVHWLSGQTDTLIAIGKKWGLLPDHSSEGWHESSVWPWFSREVSTFDIGSNPSELPRIIRWIDANDTKAWIGG